jgi:hypothetical protein
MPQLMMLNYLAVVAAAVAGWLFGAVWYGVLGKAWLAALGRTPEEIAAMRAERRMPIGPMILSFFAALLMAAMLSGIMVHTGGFSPRIGIISALLIWLGFVVTTIAVNNAFPGRKAMLTVIDSGHWLGVLVLQGLVLGLLG